MRSIANVTRGICLFVCSVAGTAVQAQETILRVNVTPLAEIDPAEKDAALLEAFKMLGPRLAELPMELDGDPEAGPFIRLAWHTLFGGTNLHVSTVPAFPGVGMALTLEPMPPLTAGEVIETVTTILEEEGAPIQQQNGSLIVPTPVGPANIEGAGNEVRLKFITDQNAPTDVELHGLPGDAQPILSFTIDLPTLSNVIGPIIAAQDPGLAQQLEASGIVGPNAPKVDLSIASTGSHLHMVQSIENGRSYLSKNGVDVDATFTNEHLQIVPADATRLVAATVSLEGILDQTVTQLVQAGGPDPFAMAQGMLGIDLRSAVFENIGPRVVFYQSDATGGGGMLSSVIVAELRDPQAFGAAHAKSVELINGFVGEMAGGYVRVRPWQLGGRDAFTLTAPGLPIPLELSWTVFDGHFVAAVTPAGLNAALQQMAAPNGSITDNIAFRAAMNGLRRGGDPASLYFSDTARFAAQGYGPTNMGLSLLANAVRSPKDAGRQVGQLMPSYSDFVSGIQPSGGVTYFEGGDAVTRWRGDASFLVHASELIGSSGGIGAIGAAGAAIGVLLPAVEQARDQAREAAGRVMNDAMVLPAAPVAVDAPVPSLVQ